MPAPHQFKFWANLCFFFSSFFYFDLTKLSFFPVENHTINHLNTHKC